MPKANWGDRMPSVYLEVFKPQPGVSHRFAILDVNRLVATEAHWVDTPLGTKGMYACHKGACCESGFFPNGPIQNYSVPIWLFLNPPDLRTGNPGGNEGILKVFRMPPSLYDMLVTLSQSLDIMDIDLLALAQPSGKSVKTNLFAAQGGSLLPKDQRAAIVQGLGDIEVQIERSICKPCSEQDWYQILTEMQAPTQQSFGAAPPVVRTANPAALFGGQALPAGQQQMLLPGAPATAAQTVRSVAPIGAPPAGVIPGMRPASVGAAPVGYQPPHAPVGAAPVGGYRPPQAPQFSDPSAGGTPEVMSQGEVDSLLSE